MDASNDGSESVDQFLARIASLNSKQGLEEAERSKKMEEEMLQARRERQARRAERARSLSPSKTGPAPSLRHVGEETPKHNLQIEPPVALTPPLQSRTLGRAGSISPKPRRPSVSGVDFSRPLPPLSADDPRPIPSPPLNATSLSRSGTLSWNQRPSPRGIGSIRSRPQSVASLPDASAALRSPTPKHEEEMSKKEISASLSTKDPSWFRQTPDRAAISPAYRKNESETSASQVMTRSMRLPGLSAEKGPTLERDELEKERGTFSSPTSPAKHNLSMLDQQHTPNFEPKAKPRPVSMISETPCKSPALELPAFKPLDLNTPLDSDAATLGRNPSVLSPSGRPLSPTKGLGGFVQSAMMKRSDSVNKRWSVQANAGLKRGDSIAASRPSHLSGASDFSPGHSRNSSKDTRPGWDLQSSPLSGSRPVSSHGAEPTLPSRGRPLSDPDDGSSKSPKARTDYEQRERSDTLESLRRQQNMRRATPPPPESPLERSPSKTMDPRRWSPTKASWLESALNKPDVPKFAPSRPETPAWKLNLQRSKVEEQTRSSAVKDAPTPKVLGSPPPNAHPSEEVSTSTMSPPSIESEPANSPGDTLKPKAARQNVVGPPADSLTVKKEGKPIVPSKRNITPASQKMPQRDTPEEKQPSTSAQTKVTEPSEEPEKPAGLELKTESKSPVVKPKPREGTDKPAGGDLKIESKSPIVKPKPRSTTEIDFRATLKSRQAPSTTSNDTEPEFKAVFGKLKRTQTQHYVAPDLLKDNITRGKAALNATGGPQKTQHVDEFKESILQKKEAMKAGGSATRKRPESIDSKAKPAEAVPEALARRMTLHKATPSKEQAEIKTPAGAPGKSTKPALHSEHRTDKAALPGTERPIPAVHTNAGTERPQAVDTNKPEVVPTAASVNKPGKVFAPPTVETAPATAAVTTEAPKRSSTEPRSGFRAPENSKIAARLNPALAGLLSRNGSPKLPGDSPSTDSSRVQVREVQHTSQGGSGEEPAELTHMTKARAKGPRRRAPKASTSKSTRQESVAPAGSRTEAGTDGHPTPPKPLPLAKETISVDLPLRQSRSFMTREAVGTEAGEKAEKTIAKPAQGAALIHAMSEPNGQQVKPIDILKTRSYTQPAPANETEPSPKSKPPVANKSAELRKVSSTIGGRQPAEKSSSMKLSTPRSFDVLTDRPSVVSSPPESDLERKANTTSPPFPSVLPLTPSKSKMNTPKASKPSSGPEKSASLTSPSKVGGLGLKFESPAAKRSTTIPELTPPPEPDRLQSRLDRSRGPTTSDSGLASQIETFFGMLPRPSEKAEFDTQQFLSSQNKAADKTKTLSNQIWQVTGNGKKTAMPPQQEHILFEDCMYLCVHTMQSPNGSSLVDVYLWCGDEVPAAAIEDAQLFCRKVARDNSTKLQVVNQGKESSEFFQALGGIVIVRKSKSSALYMLCGRRHLGHLAFDEVEFDPSNLSSGLPFLISAKFGKLYLWKGAGSDPEDVGCARLIGMDLGLTGEIEEITEGEEPSSFWESFPSGASRRQTGQESHRKGPFRGRPSKLYRVEHDRPKSSGGFWGLRSLSPPKQTPKALVEEIVPFTQNDVDAHHIHILDTYAEVYVLVGASAKKPSEFVTALHIAQEMAVLSPSVQDRPVLPSCFVVFGEPPQHIKSVFRKWTPARTSPQTGQICVRVEEVMQELGMTL
ncbi:hypothetical protein ABEF94_015498 [Exophiala dermatitidis]